MPERFFHYYPRESGFAGRFAQVRFPETTGDHGELFRGDREVEQAAASGLMQLVELLQPRPQGFVLCGFVCVRNVIVPPPGEIPPERLVDWLGAGILPDRGEHLVAELLVASRAARHAQNDGVHVEQPFAMQVVECGGDLAGS